jgi:RNA polymerase sigma factor (sigma-70 family)
MAHNMKTKDPATSTDAEGSPAEDEAGKELGVTTSGIRKRPGSGTAAGSTAMEQILSTYEDMKDELRPHLLKARVRFADMEEVMQRLRLALIRRVTNLGPPDKPHAFILTVARTEAMRFALEQRRHPLLPHGDGDGGGGDGDDDDDDDDDGRELAAPSSRQGPAQQMLRAERMHRVAEAFEKLPPADTALIKMAYLDELPQAEIAEKLGISPEAVSTRCRRALARLKELARRGCTKDDLGGAA